MSKRISEWDLPSGRPAGPRTGHRQIKPGHPPGCHRTTRAASHACNIARHVRQEHGTRLLGWSSIEVVLLQPPVMLTHLFTTPSMGSSGPRAEAPQKGRECATGVRGRSAWPKCGRSVRGRSACPECVPKMCDCAPSACPVRGPNVPRVHGRKVCPECAPGPFFKGTCFLTLAHSQPRAIVGRCPPRNASAAEVVALQQGRTPHAQAQAGQMGAVQWRRCAQQVAQGLSGDAPAVARAAPLLPTSPAACRNTYPKEASGAARQTANTSCTVGAGVTKTCTTDSAGPNPELLEPSASGPCLADEAKLQAQLTTNTIKPNGGPDQVRQRHTDRGERRVGSFLHGLKQLCWIRPNFGGVHHLFSSPRETLSARHINLSAPALFDALIRSRLCGCRTYVLSNATCAQPASCIMRFACVMSPCGAVRDLLPSRVLQAFLSRSCRHDGDEVLLGRDSRTRLPAAL